MFYLIAPKHKSVPFRFYKPLNLPLEKWGSNISPSLGKEELEEFVGTFLAHVRGNFSGNLYD
jgi:hypothetical protein